TASADPVVSRDRRVRPRPFAISAGLVRGIEDNFKISPYVILGDRQFVGLALTDRAHQTFRSDLKQRVGATIEQGRLRRQGSVLMQHHSDRDADILCVVHAQRHDPTRLDPRPQRVNFVRRKRGGGATRQPKGRRRVDLLAGDALATRIALVEQRGRLDGIKSGRRLRRRRRLDRRRLGRLLRRLRLGRLGLLRLVLFQSLERLGGRVGLGLFFGRRRLRLDLFGRRGCLGCGGDLLLLLDDLGRRLFLRRRRVGGFFGPWLWPRHLFGGFCAPWGVA